MLSIEFRMLLLPLLIRNPTHNIYTPNGALLALQACGVDVLQHCSTVCITEMASRMQACEKQWQIILKRALYESVEEKEPYMNPLKEKSPI